MFGIATAIVLAAAVQASDAKDVYGYWTTENGATVQIEQCDGSPCGYVRSVDVDQLEPAAREVALLDYRNPDEDKRARPIIGVQMLGDYQATDDGWRKGFVYDPEAGREYKSTLTRIGANELEMKGCVAFVCRTQIWTSTEMTPAKEAAAKAVSPGGGKPTAAEAGITEDPRGIAN